jgi:hypothetical protein
MWREPGTIGLRFGVVSGVDIVWDLGRNAGMRSTDRGHCCEHMARCGSASDRKHVTLDQKDPIPATASVMLELNTTPQCSVYQKSQSRPSCVLVAAATSKRTSHRSRSMTLRRQRRSGRERWSIYSKRTMQTTQSYITTYATIIIHRTYAILTLYHL